MRGTCVVVLLLDSAARASAPPPGMTVPINRSPGQAPAIRDVHVARTVATVHAVSAAQKSPVLRSESEALQKGDARFPDSDKVRGGFNSPLPDNSWREDPSLPHNQLMHLTQAGRRGRYFPVAKFDDIDVVVLKSRKSRVLFRKMLGEFQLPNPNFESWSGYNGFKKFMEWDGNEAHLQDLPVVAMHNGLPCAAVMFSNAMFTGRRGDFEQYKAPVTGPTEVLAWMNEHMQGLNDFMLFRHAPPYVGEWNGTEEEFWRNFELYRGGEKALLCHVIRNSKNVWGNFIPAKLFLGWDVYDPEWVQFYLDQGCMFFKKELYCDYPDPDGCEDYIDDTYDGDEYFEKYPYTRKPPPVYRYKHVGEQVYAARSFPEYALRVTASLTGTVSGTMLLTYVLRLRHSIRDGRQTPFIAA